MEKESSGLEALKKRMTETQRRDMAELLANELRNRAASKSPAAAPSAAAKSTRSDKQLSREQVKELYQSVNKRMQSKQAPVNAKGTTEAALPSPADLDSLSDKVTLSRSMRFRLPSANVLLMVGIAAFGTLKILLSTGVVVASDSRTPGSPRVDATVAASPKPQSENSPAANTAQNGAAVAGRPLEDSSVAIAQVHSRGDDTARATITSATDRQLLTDLESRRVALEKRRIEIENRAEELVTQERELATRLAELRTLTRQLAEHRVEKDQAREARLEQLANVYGAMAPQEAAPLIAQLDEAIALDLLQRLPGKRMAQVLSSMDPARAVEITKKLSERAPTSSLTIDRASGEAL